MDNTLFPSTIITQEEVIENYMEDRSFLRTANTRSLEEKVDGEDIHLVSKWEQMGATGKRMNSQPMKHHYAQFDLLIKPFKRYTYQV